MPDADRGLAIVESLSEPLADYQPWHAARAALLAMTGKHAMAAAAYGEAISRARSRADILLLEKRLAGLPARS